MPTDPSTCTDVRTLIRLRDDYLAEIELAKESITTAESKLSAVTTQLRSIANEARALLATIDPPIHPLRSRTTSTSAHWNTLSSHIDDLPPSTSYPFSYFSSTFPQIPGSTLSQLLERLVQAGIINRTPGHSRGHFTTRPPRR